MTDDLISDVQRFINQRPDPWQRKPLVLPGFVARWCSTCGPANVLAVYTREAEKRCPNCGGQTVSWARRFGSEENHA